jgi:hypothetical protein
LLDVAEAMNNTVEMADVMVLHDGGGELVLEYVGRDMLKVW